jgi:hypothetical protein
VSTMTKLTVKKVVPNVQKMHEMQNLQRIAKKRANKKKAQDQSNRLEKDKELVKLLVTPNKKPKSLNMRKLPATTSIRRVSAESRLPFEDVIINNPILIERKLEYPDEDESMDNNLEWENFLAKRTTVEISWNKLVSSDPDGRKAEILAEHLPNPDLALTETEIDIADLFISENYEDEEAQNIAKDVCMQLALRKEFLALQKRNEDNDIKKRETEEVEMPKRLNALKDKPTIRLTHLVEDLYEFQVYLSSHSVKEVEYLPLLRMCVPTNKCGMIETLIEEGSCNGKTWDEIKPLLLQVLNPEKPRFLYMKELRSLTPKWNETMYEYHERFMAYINILQIENEEAANVFIGSLPMEYQKEIDCFRYNPRDYNDVVTDLNQIIGHLWRLYKKPESYCYKSDRQKTPKDFSRNKPNGKCNRYNKEKVDQRPYSERVGGLKKGENQKGEKHEKGDRDYSQHTCWKCGKNGHVQPTCKEPEGPTVKDNLYRPKIEPRKQPKDFKNKKKVGLRHLRISLSNLRANEINMNKFRNQEIALNDVRSSLNGSFDPLNKQDEIMDKTEELEGTVPLIVEKLQYIKAKLHGEEVVTLVDSGSQTLTVSQGIVDQIKQHSEYPVTVSEPYVQVTVADDRTIVCSTVTLELEYEGSIQKHTFVVLPISRSDVIFGKDIM